MSVAESLDGALRHGLRSNIALSLRELAASVAVRGELEPAARIFGAAEAIDEQTGWQMEPSWQAAFEVAMKLVADRADEPEIAGAWAAGKATTESDAAAYALATVADQPPR